MAQYRLDRAFGLSIWLESLICGFYLCLFCVGIYINHAFRKEKDGHSRIMFYAGIVVFFKATFHLGK
ncbi:unnamed protein product [Somion occarium]|uniref:Uncharacterized protein n=1 Tax=Somion occarium TaxID=3059160 RepID=A0ABP1DZ15_9APHY